MTSHNQDPTPYHNASQTTNRILITTPEGVRLTLTPAGPGSRFLALCIDYGLILIISKIISMLSSLFWVINQQFTVAFILILQFLVSWVYFISFEWFNHGQSPGKRVFGLRVADLHGFNLQPSQVILRNLLRFIDTLPVLYLVGAFVSMFSDKHQRIGDLIASTVVIYDRHFYLPKIEQIVPDKYNSFYSYPYLVSRTRQQITPYEASLALRALLRRDKLFPGARIRLYRELVKYFRSIVNFPVEDISDEQYLRNLLGVLYLRKVKGIING